MREKLSIYDLADLFISKYAIKEDLHCKCEQLKCKQMGFHEPGKCRNLSKGKASMYLGPICDECAMFLDPQYLISD